MNFKVTELCLISITSCPYGVNDEDIVELPLKLPTCYCYVTYNLFFIT